MNTPLATMRARLRPAFCSVATWAALAWSDGTAPLFWPWLLAILGGAALALAHIDGDPPAPAQRADRVWFSFAVLALLAGALLLIMPRGMVPYWPWRLSAPLVAQYAPVFLAWGVAAWLMSRERRCYLREPMSWGWLVWAAGVLLASLWHVTAFRLDRAPSWLWFAVFVATAVMAAHQVWPNDWRHRRKALGPQPRDAGSDRRPH